MSRGSHARFGFASLFRLCVVVLALSLAAARGALAVDPLNVGFSAPSIDLLQQGVMAPRLGPAPAAPPADAANP